MKVAPVLVAALVIYIAIPGSDQGKGKKPKYCTGEDGNRYKKGDGYEDKEACIRYTCTKKGKTFKMKEEKIKCTEPELNGYCLTSGGQDQNSGTQSLNPGDKDACYHQCKAVRQASGCEWHKYGTCIYHTLDVATGNGNSDYKCWVFNSSPTEPEPNLAANVTVIEAGILFLNGSMKSMENKMEALQTNVTAIEAGMRFLNGSMESMESKMDALQTSMESIIGMMTAMQSTSSKLETCLGDVNSTDCPSSEDGKISVVDAIKGNMFNLVLTGGLAYSGSIATSEIISPGGVCSQSIPSLPVAVYGAQSVYFNNTLMVCGGQVHKKETGFGGYMKKCHQLRDSNSQWTEGPAMNIPRCHFSMTKVGQDLYALGGRNERGQLDSMEKLSESSGQWTIMEQNLTSHRSGHCTVFMETTRSLVIIGGGYLVEEFRLATSTWKELAPLPVQLSDHACEQLGQTIVITGGYDGKDPVNKKVYTFTGGQWEMTGELQEGRYYLNMGTLDNKLLIIGGHEGGDYKDSIEEMQQDGSFRIIEWKLNERKTESTTTQVPREMFPCL